MKIAFVTIGDTRDIRRGSGTPYFLWQELLRQGHTVHLVGRLEVKTPFLTRFFKWASNRLGKKYLSYRDPFMGRALGRAAGDALRGLDFNLILTNDYCLAGYTRTDKPVVLYTDAIFPRKYAENVHPWLADLSSIAVYFCQRTTARGLRRADRCIFASHYAADEAKKYGASNQESFSVIPYGANMPDPGPRPARTIEDIRRKGHIDLLFVGKDWELKGGHLAVEITRLLNQRGIRAHLHIVGVDLAAHYPDAFVTFYGLLNKDVVDDNAQLEKLFFTCDVLLVPSRAEGYGLVFVEAAAYGMPCLAYANTGVMTAVKEGVSGVLFASQDGKGAFANQIQRWMSVPKSYETLCQSARTFYEQSANWQMAVARLVGALTITQRKS